MVKLVEAAVAATRKIVTDLRPSVLDDLGLAAAVRWQASEFQKHTGVAIEVEAPYEDAPVHRDTALALFRIFQETLTNVARHAKATHVWVDLSLGDAGYVLRVRDDGDGMSEKELIKGDVTRRAGHARARAAVRRRGHGLQPAGRGNHPGCVRTRTAAERTVCLIAPAGASRLSAQTRADRDRLGVASACRAQDALMVI